MKMPPPFRNGMYAAYSAAFSRMLSESTPGREPEELPLKRSLAAICAREQVPIIEEQCLGNEPRGQRVTEQQALPEQLFMITEQIEPRHPGGEPRERGLVLGMEARRAAAGAGG